MYQLINPEIMDYKTLEDGICITKVKTDIPFIVIPQFIGSLPVTHIGDFALFSNGDSNYIDMPTVLLPETIKYIGQGAFENFVNIEEIVFTKNLIELGKSACKNLAKLKNIVFRNCNKLTDIPESCFENCRSLKKIYLPKNIENIGSKSFYGIKKLDLYLSDQISAISEDAFGLQKGNPKITLHFPPNFDYKFLNLGKDITCLNDNNSVNDDFEFKYRKTKNGLFVNGLNGSNNKIIIPDYAIKNGEKLPIIGVEMQEIDNLYPIEEIKISKNIEILSMCFTDRTVFLAPFIVDHNYASFTFRGRTVCFIKKGCKLESSISNSIIAYENFSNINVCLSKKSNIFEKSSLSYQDYKNINELMEKNEFDNINLQDIIFQDNFIYLVSNDKGYIVAYFENIYNSEIIIKNEINLNGKIVPIVSCLKDAFKDISTCSKLVISKNIEIIGNDAFTGNFECVTFEEDAHLRFIGEGNFINTHNQIILPHKVKAIFGQNFSSEYGFKINLCSSLEYLGPGSFNNCFDKILPKGIKYLEYFCNDNRSLAFEDGANLAIFLSATNIEYSFEITTQFNGCLYAGPRTNPFMILFKVQDITLPCIKIHDDCKVVLMEAFEIASNVMKIILNEKLISFFCLFYNFCAPTIEKWPKSLKFVSREYLDAFKRVRCDPLTSSTLPAEVRILSNIQNSYYHNFERSDTILPPIFGHVVKVDPNITTSYGLKSLIDWFLDPFYGNIQQIISPYRNIELVSCNYVSKKIKPIRKRRDSNELQLPLLDFTLFVNNVRIEIFIDRYYSNIWYKEETDDDFDYATEIPDRIIAALYWIKENYIFK